LRYPNTTYEIPLGLKHDGAVREPGVAGMRDRLLLQRGVYGHPLENFDLDRTGAVRHRRFYVAYAGRYPPGRKLLSVILRVRYVVGVLIRHPRVKSACLFRNAVDEFLQDAPKRPPQSWVAPSLTAPRLHSTGFFFLACRTRL
jgi:hypothetical protein